jgi:hypothetical protein
MRSAHLQQIGIRKVVDVTDELVVPGGDDAVMRFGLRHGFKSAGRVLEVARAAGLSDREVLMLCGYLQARARGYSFGSAPTARKYARIARDLGLAGVLDGVADDVSYSIDWDKALVELTS